jgi:halocin C8-like bacteriocin domain-containing protein
MSDDKEISEFEYSRINKSVEDGGGCVEAWEAMNDVREENSTRRSMLRQLLGGVITLSAMASGHAVASDESRPRVTQVEGREKNQLLSHFTTTSEYGRLVQRVRSDGYNVRFRQTATVLRTKQENRTIEIAYAPVEQTEFDEAYLTIGHEVEVDGVTVAGIEYATKDRVSPSEYGISTDQSTTASAEITSSITLIDATGGSINQQIYNDPSHAVANGPKEEIGTMGVYCTACKANVDLLCYYGCGAPVWILCGFLAIPSGGLGGFACGGFVTGACGLISLYGCEASGVSDRVCSHSTIDLC